MRRKENSLELIWLCWDNVKHIWIQSFYWLSPYGQLKQRDCCCARLSSCELTPFLHLWYFPGLFCIRAHNVCVFCFHMMPASPKQSPPELWTSSLPTGHPLNVKVLYVVHVMKRSQVVGGKKDLKNPRSTGVSMATQPSLAKRTKGLDADAVPPPQRLFDFSYTHKKK